MICLTNASMPFISLFMYCTNIPPYCCPPGRFLICIKRLWKKCLFNNEWVTGCFLLFVYKRRNKICICYTERLLVLCVCTPQAMILNWIMRIITWYLMIISMPEYPSFLFLVFTLGLERWISSRDPRFGVARPLRWTRLFVRTLSLWFTPVIHFAFLCLSFVGSVDLCV